LFWFAYVSLCPVVVDRSCIDLSEPEHVITAITFEADSLQVVPNTVLSTMAPHQHVYPSIPAYKSPTARTAYPNTQEARGRDNSEETIAAKMPPSQEWSRMSSKDLEKSQDDSGSRPKPTATFRRPSFLTSFRAMCTGVSEARLATIPRRLSVLSKRPRRSSVITRHVEGLFSFPITASGCPISLIQTSTNVESSSCSLQKLSCLMAHLLIG
jgi:hypothetical protein